MRRTMGLLACLAVAVAGAWAEEPATEGRWRPDPFMAGLLSWTMPGTGQIYAHAWTKGSLVMMAEVCDKTILVFLLARINSRYGREGTGEVTINWNALRWEDKGLLGGYLLASSVFRVWNALDAVKTAEGFGKRSTLRRGGVSSERSGGTVAVGFGTSDAADMDVRWTLRF